MTEESPIRNIDVSTMTDAEIVAHAHELIAEARVPDADPEPLIAALRNAAARARALEDPYWRDLTNKEAAEYREETWEAP
ncbi:hypothetical protein C8K38_111187 [Rhodococcus sp. OK611]|uniref:hypothetical protein n=1 Tax=unclassified Rhodococcus (in: high G+C Gram-positive bacteria) TaxID=192944 RepID=UPI000BD794F6|nr:MULTISPECIES: hypothetical protein [unclassified Rhodococcus (in: high G+C Gram-positive bacteria)]PTR42018.1 hypothetical protein C8K38_111187 [Rhodococcus sp. OK611]SNX91535.1 hypothetical protein SAMN05447004_11070 [Rhodococcus sp. OK270]